jgi:hypothetical protein
LEENRMTKAPEESARAILRIIVSRGVGPNEIDMFGAVQSVFVRPDASLAQEFAEGLAYAVEQSWLVVEETQIRLTQAGYEAAS